MMTTLAALFGGMPLALGSGTGSELRRPLGIAIVGGLLVSQLLTLYYDAGHLPLVRPPRRRDSAGAASDVGPRPVAREHLRAVHSPADRDARC